MGHFDVYNLRYSIIKLYKNYKLLLSYFHNYHDGDVIYNCPLARGTGDTIFERHLPGGRLLFL